MTEEQSQDVKANKFEKADGYEMWHWPETQAMLKRLGVDTDAPTTNLIIRIPVDGYVTVTHEFFGLDLNAPKVLNRL